MEITSDLAIIDRGKKETYLLGSGFLQSGSLLFLKGTGNVEPDNKVSNLIF